MIELDLNTFENSIETNEIWYNFEIHTPLD